VEFLGKKIDVLDDGFVRVVDVMGDDAAVVQAARVSYGDGTKKISEDKALIRYLMRHGHTSPFEMCEIKFHLRVPMDCWRQWTRHRTASINEYSTRYSIALDATQKTAPGMWRKQSSKNKQGSDGFFDEEVGAELSRAEAELHSLARKTYEHRLALGVAREQARKDLPLCTYTEAYWKIDLHNLLRFLSLRMHPTAQYEIRAYAFVIWEDVVKPWVPLTAHAFEDYVLGSMTFSVPELQMLKLLIAGQSRQEIENAYKCFGWASPDCGERRDFEFKVALLGIKLPST